MEPTLKLEHHPISFFDRTKYYLLLYVGFLSFAGLFQLINGQSRYFWVFLVVFTLCAGFYLVPKVYRARYFLLDFYADSNRVWMTYLHYSQEHKLECSLDALKIELRDISSRFNFNCELILEIEGKKFYLNNDFDWGKADLKKLLDYLGFHTDLQLSVEEKATLERFEQQLKKTPF
ncbi:hypothetical protein [Flavobacterium sp.]|uniref:hypothetical protein n=1 Tax=Flavobacterium sp. TaxID=239 RepID=UPI0039E29599